MKDNEKGGKTAKGIKKNVIKKNIKHVDYKNVLFNNKQMRHKIKRLEVKITNSEAMTFIKCHYLASMTNATFIRMIYQATLTVIIEY